MIEAKIVSDNVHMIPLISKLLEYTQQYTANKNEMICTTEIHTLNE